MGAEHTEASLLNAVLHLLHFAASPGLLGWVCRSNPAHNSSPTHFRMADLLCMQWIAVSDPSHSLVSPQPKGSSVHNVAAAPSPKEPARDLSKSEELYTRKDKK